MSSIAHAIRDSIRWSIEKIEDTASVAWNVFFVKPLEIVVGIFGIEDENVIFVQKTSNAIYSSSTEDVDDAMKKRAVISMTQTGGTFFDWYMAYTGLTKAQIDAYYRFAAQDRYLHSLPSAEIRSGSIDYAAIDAALDTEIGVPCTRLNASTMLPTDAIYFKDKLQAAPTHYKPWANTLTHLDPGGISRDDYRIDTITFNAGTGNFEIAIHRIDALGATISDTLVEANYVPERSLIITYYVTGTPETEWFYWVYKLSATTYPDIDTEISAIGNMDMLPVGILVKDGVAIDVDKTTDEYKSTRLLLKALELDIDTIIDTLKADETNYQYIEDCYVNFAIAPQTLEEIVSKALWLTFYNIIVVNDVTVNIDTYIATFTEQAINNAMVWGSHTHETGKVGTIIGGGEYHHEIEFIPEIEEYDWYDDTYKVTQEESSNLWIRHQTAPNVYSEIKVYGLNGMSSIEKNGMWDMALYKLGDENFTIPMSYYVLQGMNARDQLTLYQYVLRLDIYAAEIQHLEFYETAAFGQLFELVMLVITVYSLGTASSFVQVLRQLVLQYAVNRLVLYIAEVTGNAALAAVVGMVAMIALGGTGKDGVFSFTSGEALINASTNFANNLTAAYGQEAEELQKDMNALNATATERLEEIEEAAGEANPITAEFLVALQGVDTTMFPAIKAQYDYALIYDYDRLIADYYDLTIRTGVT